MWVTDLTSPDPYYVFPVAMGLTMLIQMWSQPAPQDQPQMKYFMRAMPFVITFVMLNLPAGLSLYMFTNNVLQIFQQSLLKRNKKSALKNKHATN